jgi:hypothetical protein
MHPTQTLPVNAADPSTRRFDGQPVSDADRRSVDVVTPAGTLRFAAAYLLEHGWIQGDMFANPDQDNPAACALGAIRMAVIGTTEVSVEHLRVDVLSTFDHTVGVLADHLVDAYGVDLPGAHLPTPVVFTGDLEHVVVRWNDEPQRIASHVIAAMHGAAEQWDTTHGGVA